MTDPFAFSAQQHSVSSYIPTGSSRSHNGLSSRLSSEASFQDFYRKVAAEPDFTSGFTSTSSINRFASYIAEQSSSGYPLSQQFQSDIYRSGASIAGINMENSALDLLRQDLEQSYQNSENLLNRERDFAADRAEPVVLDRRAEMQERQHQEQAQAAHSNEQNRLEEQRNRDREQARQAAEARTQAQAEAKVEQPKQTRVDKAVEADGQVKETAAAQALQTAETARTAKEAKDAKDAVGSQEALSTEKAENTLVAAKNAAGQAAAKDGQEEQKGSQTDPQKNSAKNSQNATGQKNEAIAQANQADKSEVLTADAKAVPQSGKATDRDGADSKLKIQVIDERTAKQSVTQNNAEQAKHSAGQADTEIDENAAKTAAKTTTQTAAGGTDKAADGATVAVRQQLAAQSGLANGETADEKDGKVQNVGKQREKLAKLKGRDSAELSEPKAQEAADKSVARLGRVAELRKQQNEGMQYRNSSGKQQAAQAASGHNDTTAKALVKAGFEAARNFSEAHSSDSAGAQHLQPHNGPSGPAGRNGGANVLLRSLAQQMAERLQEGPLAQNLRQLQFRLLNQNRGEIRLRLNPEHLGQIRIHLNIDGSQLSGRIVADSAEAARVLQDNMQHLQSSLREGGFENQGLNVSVGGGQAGSADSAYPEFGQADRGRNKGTLAAAEDDWEELGDTAPYLQLEQSQIDYSV